MRILAAETTRENIHDRLHQELSHAITVETTQWRMLRNNSVGIEQTVFVERGGQKKIVLGRGGQTIEAISSEAQAEIAEAAGSPVHSFLFVKERENWADDPERYRGLGSNSRRPERGVCLAFAGGSVRDYNGSTQTAAIGKR